MPTAIWKVKLEVTDVQPLLLPPCKFLSVATQHDSVCIWFLVPDTDAKRVLRNVYIVSTGQSCNFVLDKQFVGTFQMFGGNLIFHVFVDA
jgi:hypothetical protein